ncbi:hypothetical protein LEP1GSC072_0989 [Leptospira noguchii str. Bonito]|nr:hypothetical protein LEP1GSC072_0989 [Leptospira noguchii str. Bonito]
MFRFKLKLFSFFNPTLKLSRFIEKSNRFRLREIHNSLFRVGTTAFYFLSEFKFSFKKTWNYCKITFLINS